MARCRCSEQCLCQVVGGDNILVTGSGSDADPYIVTGMPVATGTVAVTSTTTVDATTLGTGTVADPYVIAMQAHIEDLLRVGDTDTVDMSMIGSGAVGDPFVISASVLGFGDLSDADAGDTIIMGGDGEWTTGPNTTAPPGVVMTGQGLVGDGSAGDPLAVYIPTYAVARTLAVAP